jgi:dTDP-4-amino-4,6-dideoxygalactose transaminase
MINLSEPQVGEEEKQALCSVIDSGWLTMGERVTEFEDAFARLHRMPAAVAVNSCTAGLHLCLLANNIGQGDEVLVPSLTFVATVNAVLYVGATPVFVDIESEESPHISLQDAKEKMTSRTKAAIVMHYAGYLVDLPAWRKFADENSLILIEDAAHAPAVGEVGRVGDATAFSFFSNKNMSTAEGGMVLARDPAVLERAKNLRSHGMTTNTLDRHRGHANSYDVMRLGFNYRMDELRAAIGLVQLAKLPDWNARRRQLSELYRELFTARCPEVVIPFTRGQETAAHLLPVLLPFGVNRDQLMDGLRSAGVQSSIHYPPVHRFSYYRELFPQVSLPNTENYHARELSLPIHPALKESEVEIVVDTIKGLIFP